MTSPHPTIKWLVQNGRDVLFRNALSERSTSPELFDMRLDISVLGKDGKVATNTVIYRSHVVPQCLNPTWTFSGMTATDEAISHFSAEKLQFRVVRCVGGAGKQEITILTEDIDLTRLVPLKQPILDGELGLPLNFLVIHIEDEYYTTERVYASFVGRGAAYTGEFFTLQKDDIEADAANTSTTNGAAIATATQRLKEMRASLEGTLSKAETLRLQTAKQNKLSELEQLRAECVSAEAALQLEKDEFEEEKQQFRKTQELQQLIQQCNAVQRAKEASEQVLNNKKLDLLKVKFLLEARKVKLLSELQTIYPIERLDSGEYAIRGVELPVDHNAKDDEQVAAALGYTVHLLLLASKYLEVPVRYQLLFMGSRSFIRDPVVGNGTTLPLFRRNVEKDRYDRAVLWLKRTAEQLLLARGVGYEANQGLLYNIQALFQCEMCPKLAI